MPQWERYDLPRLSIITSTWRLNYRNHLISWCPGTRIGARWETLGRSKNSYNPPPQQPHDTEPKFLSLDPLSHSHVPQVEFNSTIRTTYWESEFLNINPLPFCGMPLPLQNLETDIKRTELMNWIMCWVTPSFHSKYVIYREERGNCIKDMYNIRI